MNPNIIENLKKFDLTEYEAKAYAALVSAGTASVTEVSQLCDVPRSNLYGVLESLNSKGFAEIQKGRPILFKAASPKKILDEAEKTKAKEIKNARDDTVKELEKIAAAEKSNVEPALIWAVKGPASVKTKIDEIIRRSKNEILINLPDLSFFDNHTYESLKDAKKRGVKIKIATEKRGNLPLFQEVAIVRIRKKIHGVDIVADEREILIAPTFPVVAAWVDNPEMALHVKDFLELVWKDASVL